MVPSVRRKTTEVEKGGIEERKSSGMKWVDGFQK